MKKVLILTGGFWWGWKIAEIVENFLSKHCETVTLVCFDDKWVFNIKWKKISIGTFFNLWFPWVWYIELIYHTINVIKYIKKEKPDIVIWVWSYYNFLWLIARKFLNFKLLLTQHEHITTRKANSPILASYNLVFFMVRVLIWNKKIVCVSNDVKLDAIKYYRIKENQAQTIYNWLAFDEIKKMWDEKIDIQGKYIINVWRLDTWKNQELLIKAYSKSKIRNTYKLLLLWIWNKEEYLKELCKNLNVKNLVIFAWFDKNPYKYFKKASLFCFTSKTEALPTVLIEALILDIPIITVPVTWAKEILDYWKFWVITDNWDEENLIRELDNFLDNWWKYYDIEEKNKFLNENFSVNAMERKYLDIINNL